MSPAAASQPLRRSRPNPIVACATLAVAIAWAVGIMMTPPVVHAVNGASGTTGSIALDTPRIDAATLDRRSPDGTPMLLVVDPLDDASDQVRVDILERDGDWRVTTGATIDLDPSMRGARGQPWIVGLGSDRFVLIVVADDRAMTELVSLAVSGDPGHPSLAVVERGTIGSAIDEAGSADADGDGATDLILASARTTRNGGTCQSSTLFVLAGGRLGDPVRMPVNGVRLASGVLGRFAPSPGDTLVAYSYPTCPAGPDRATGLRMLAIRLRDGVVLADVSASGVSTDRGWVPPPVRFDADRDGRDELLALVPGGVSVVDPWAGWSVLPLASPFAFPLGATAAIAPDGSQQTQVAWLEPSAEGRGSIGAAAIARAGSGGLEHGPATVLRDPTPSSRRWLLVVQDAVAAAAQGSGSVALRDATTAGTCSDLIVPSGVLGCQTGRFRPGPAWIGTRPLVAVAPTRSAPRLVVALGLERDPRTGVPSLPDPWAGRPDGAWRRGPSGMFALTEVAMTDLASAQAPAGHVSVEPIVEGGAFIELRGPAGIRLAVDIAPLSSDPERDPPTAGGVTPQTPGVPDDVARSLVRLPPVHGTSDEVRTGMGIKIDRSAPAGGAPSERWSVSVTPLDAVGEPGELVVGVVRLDLEAPGLDLTTPVLTPVWPFGTDITGHVEPGSTVTVDGVGVVPTDVHGAFRIPLTLVPWPQDVRVVATDPAGNVTVRVVSVVGGLDYRTLPWAAILVAGLLSAVIVSGALGTLRPGERRRAPVRRTAGDDSPGPVLEDVDRPDDD